MWKTKTISIPGEEIEGKGIIAKEEAIKRILVMYDYASKVNATLKEIDDRFYADGFGIYVRDGDIGEAMIGKLSITDALTIPADEMAVRIVDAFTK